MNENRKWAINELKSNEPKRIIDALISLAFNDDDLEFVENLCIEFSHNDNNNIRSIAILCFGHLARIHGHLNTDKVLPIVKGALIDKSEIVRGQAENAKDDIYQYLNIIL